MFDAHTQARPAQPDHQSEELPIQGAQAVRGEVDRYRDLLDLIHSGIGVYRAIQEGEDFVLAESNRAGEQILGGGREVFYDKSVLEIFPGARGMELLAHFRSVWQSGEPEHLPLAFYQNETGGSWWEGAIHRLPGGEIAVVYKPVTEDGSVGAYHLPPQAESIEEQVAAAVNKERQRMGRDLHDSLNQSLHSLTLFSQTLTSMLKKKKYGRAEQVAARLQENALQALKDIRLQLYNLQPADHPDDDLLGKLENRLKRVERHAGIQAEVILEGAAEYCPQTWPTNWNADLFWIASESLNNALKHAQAKQVQIRLRCTEQDFELEIQDDGVGFDPAQVSGGGMGLDNMQRRAEMIGGRLEIVSSPGNGTRVCFRKEMAR